MVIDIHTHTFPDKLAATTIPKLEGMSHTRAYVDGTVSGLRASMARAGVDASHVDLRALGDFEDLERAEGRQDAALAAAAGGAAREEM